MAAPAEDHLGHDRTAALRAHESQVKNCENWEEGFRKRMREIGEKSGYEYAEGFKRIKIG